MSMTEMDLKDRVAKRARDLGARVHAKDVRITYADAPAPGCRLFRAAWGAGQSEGALTGLLKEGAEPDTFPLRALETLALIWSDATPDAASAAESAAFLLDALQVRQPIISQEDLAAWRARSSHSGPVSTPSLDLVDGHGALSYWWIEGTRATRILIEIDPSGHIAISEAGIEPSAGEGS
jgi:hypothetical protein